MFTYYQTTTEYSCGVDLHSRQMYVCVMDKDGKVLVHRNVRGNDFDYFLKLVEPYKHSLTVCCECTFNWYWLADACMDAGMEFVLGHALYMRAIHSFKTKNDRRDCWQIAHLLRSNLIPPAYVYPREKRPARALLRQRTTFVWKRSEYERQAFTHHASKRRAARNTHPTRNPPFVLRRSFRKFPILPPRTRFGSFFISSLAERLK